MNIEKIREFEFKVKKKAARAGRNPEIPPRSLLFNGNPRLLQANPNAAPVPVTTSSNAMPSLKQ